MTTQPTNRYISMTYRYGQRILCRLLRKHNIPMEAGQLPFFFQVHRSPGISQERLSANIGMDKGTTARMITQLENGGLVTRNPDARDRRINRLYTTEAADAVLPGVQMVLKEFHSLLYQGLSEEEIAAANDLLIRMKDNLRRYLNES